MLNKKSVIFVLLISASIVSFAQSTPTSQNGKALPTDSRMVVMKYNASQIYNVLAAQDYLTHIELQAGEQLTLNPAMGDTVQWQVEAEGNHIFIRPDVANIRTNMTLVTNKRTYHFMLLSSPEGGVYYQHVQFKYPETSLKLSKSTAVLQDGDDVAKKESDQNSFQISDPTKNNFDYVITGSAKFKPESVQDNGKFVYIKFPDKLEDLPIIYVKENNGAFSQVNVTRTVKGNFVTVTRLADELVLVLDDEKISVKKKKTGFWN
ncbi:MAG: TrbG/VirB9 family P-type conjugative transfer protein [Chitinophagaceae bacterium]|nr:TrbG/VirB9 family P-type conjugative transfer protein [Chitinophagaceae bacterium]